MNTWIAAALASLVSLPAIAADALPPRVQQVTFKSEVGSVQFKQKIKGYQTAEYKLVAKAGQTLTVDFKSSNTSAYFNVAAPGADEALFNGSIMGDHFAAAVPADGEYTVQVYLMRNAARRQAVASYSLSLWLSDNASADAKKPATKSP
ncbi:hypothetical protein ACIP8I_19760 [Pseudomonas sp. NPDC088414]|uniref:hypothetical protein n=1 Tax=Pseudomonas sp. NPDC088414 TaxID=3364454 RepID=UPI0037F89B1C